MKKLLILSAFSILSVYITFCVFLFSYQRSFIYHPTPMLTDDKTPKLNFKNGDADLVVSTHPQESHQAILYFGGNAEFASDALSHLIPIFPKTAVYALHYRGYSGSTGTSNEKDLVADGAALFDLIYKKHNNITIIGSSLGSGIALQVASMRPASRLVLVTPYNSILELAEEQFKYMPISWLLQDKYESWRFASKISIPTTIIAAENDEVIPVSSAQRLASHFNAGVASFVVISSVGHNDISTRHEYVSALMGVQK